MFPAILCLRARCSVVRALLRAAACRCARCLLLLGRLCVALRCCLLLLSPLCALLAAARSFVRCSALFACCCLVLRARFALLNTYPSPFVLNQKFEYSVGFEFRRRIMETLGLILLDSLDLGGHEPGAPLLVLEGGSPAQKVQMCDLEKHELLLHGLVRGSFERSMTEKALTGALTRIDRGRNFRLAGINSAWHRCEAMKMRMLFEYCMRQVKHPGFSRFVVVNRLRGVFVGAGGRLPGADTFSDVPDPAESQAAVSQQPSPDAAAAGDNDASAAPAGDNDASATPAGDDDASAEAFDATITQSSECEE